MSVNQFLNGKLNLIAGAGGINGDCDSKIFTGTTAEYEAQKDNIEDGTIINITDDIEEGIFIDIEEVLDRVAELEADVEDIKNSGGGGSSSAVYLTQEQYDALPDDKLTNNIEYRITDTSEDVTARNIGYDNSSSGLEAVNIQGAVDELSESLGGLDIRYNSETGLPEWKERGADTFTPFKSGGFSEVGFTYFVAGAVEVYYIVKSDNTVVGATYNAGSVVGNKIKINTSSNSSVQALVDGEYGYGSNSSTLTKVSCKAGDTIVSFNGNRTCMIVAF